MEIMFGLSVYVMYFILLRNYDMEKTRIVGFERTDRNKYWTSFMRPGTGYLTNN